MTKILVIEDHNDLRNDVVEMLKLEKYTALGAENGRSGIEAAHRELPDLILCDIMMPELNGYEVLERVRKNPLTATIPFIFLTAKTDRFDQRHGMVLGADDYLTKPFVVDELLDSVRSQLQKRADLNAAANRRVEELRNSIVTSLPHELRTPLNTIIGFSDMMSLEAHRLKPDQITDWANHINSAARRLFRMVENHLYYSRLVVSLQSPQALAEARRFTTHDTHAVIDLQATQQAEQMGRIDDLRLTITENRPTRIHSDDLSLIVKELVENALKFSEPGDQVVISGGPLDEYYEICIEDYGRGIQAQDIKNIAAYVQFERGYYEQQGIGLGLAIAKALMALYDGHVAIESDYGERTRVTLQIPLAEA